MPPRPNLPALSERNPRRRDLNDFDILILPGGHNSGSDHWQNNWEAAFSNMRRVEQDDWEVPIYSDWSRRLTEAVKRCERPVLLVAHSLGTALATRWSQQADTKTVAGAFLVATSDIDRLAGTPGHPMRGFDPIIMQRLPFPSVVLASRNDERVAFERAEAFASAWSIFLPSGRKSTLPPAFQASQISGPAPSTRPTAAQSSGRFLRSSHSVPA